MSALTSTPVLSSESFRDPSGCVLHYGGRILRIVSREALPELRTVLESRVFARYVAEGGIVASTVLGARETEALLEDPAVRLRYEALGGAAIVEHERIVFPSYAYEWPPEMLHAAGAFTLKLAAELLPDGLGLKDATPYNVLFRGPRPVFVDLLSVERRRAGDPIWRPYAQFMRTFALPLLAGKAFGIGIDQMLATRRDGLEPEQVYAMASPLRRLAPPFLSTVSLPSWLGRRVGDDRGIYAPKETSPEKARFVLESMFGRLRRLMRKLEPVESRSVWSGYMQSCKHYSSAEFAAKENATIQFLEQYRPASVLDVGCNTGHFSALCARSGAEVVAVDTDSATVGRVWRLAQAEQLRILPLAVDLTRPSPGLGWRNAECRSFLDRARGAFDAVLMLAVIHHMIVTERVPLREILALAAELTRKFLLIEFVHPSDPMFLRLTRGRDELHKDLTADAFVAACTVDFDVLSTHSISATRQLYVLSRKRT